MLVQGYAWQRVGGGKDGKENNGKSQQRSVRCGQGCLQQVLRGEGGEVHDKDQPFWLPWQVEKLFVD